MTAMGAPATHGDSLSQTRTACDSSVGREGVYMPRVLANRLCKITLLTVLAAVGVGRGRRRHQQRLKGGRFVGTYTIYAPDVVSGPLGTLTLSPGFSGQMQGPNYGAGFIWSLSGGVMQWGMADPMPEAPGVCMGAGVPFPYLCVASMDLLARHSRTGLASQKHPGTLIFTVGNITTVDPAGWWAVRTS